MKWPLKSKPVPGAETPFFNRLYLNAHGAGGPDSTIVWTSEVPWEPIKTFIDQHNQDGSPMIGTTHLLVQAVGWALARHPELNRRVVGRRVFDYAQCHVCLATRSRESDEVNILLVPDVDQKNIRQIANFIWKLQLSFHRNDAPNQRDRDRLRRLPGWLFGAVCRTSQWLDRRFSLPVLGRIDRLRESAVLVNDFSHARFPVMRGYKPSRQPDESKPLSVTLGRPEERVVWHEGRPVARHFAPLCVRSDHRICDSFQLSRFISTLIEMFGQPARMESKIVEQTPAAELSQQLVLPSKKLKKIA